MSISDNNLKKRFGSLPEEIIVFGGTGQAKVDREIIELWGSRVLAVVDETPNLLPPFLDKPLLDSVATLKKYLAGRDLTKLGFVVAIANPNGAVRLRIEAELSAWGCRPVTLVHPAAWVSESAKIGAGCQIMAGAIIGVDAVLGRQCLINTRASVDHDCVLQDGVQIAPGAILCGLVTVGHCASVYAGATLLPRISIGEFARIGAGAVVLNDVPAQALCVGVPAKVIK